jgi:hypothetical protein
MLEMEMLVRNKHYIIEPIRKLRKNEVLWIRTHIFKRKKV